MMGAYGRQPSGMIRLQDGTLWDPNTPLPVQQAVNSGGYASTPLGSPVQGNGTFTGSLPGAVGGPQMPAAAPPPAPGLPPAAPLGVTSSAPIGGMLGSRGLDVATPKIKPSFLSGAGLGGKIINGLNEFSTTALALGGNSGAQQQLATRAAVAQQDRQDAREAARQQEMLARQIAIRQWAAEHPEPTATMRNATAGGLTPGTDAYNRWVLENGGTPHFVTLGNAESGYQVQQFGGAPSAAPQTKTINGTTYYNIGGEWYDNPEGN